MLLIEIEGMDGAGKTTAAQTVVRELEPILSVPIRYVAFPHEQTIGGRLSRAWLNRRWNLAEQMENRYAHQMMQLGSRLEWLETRPEGIVVADRWRLSARCYGALDGLPSMVVDALLRAIPVADLRFWLDVSIDRSLERRAQGCDYETRANREIVRELYRANASEYQRIDADLPAREVRDWLVRTIRRQLGPAYEKLTPGAAAPADTRE